jgi:ribonuclease J
MNGLKFLAISGTTGVTENFYVYEYGSDIIVVDCGVAFPEPEMYGVDLVIPDFTYLRENRDRLRAILISHGHEDHLGALPFLLKEIKVPVYATKLVGGFIAEKLDDYRIKNYELNVFDPESDILTLGAFKITPFRVSHSVPDGVGFCIATPEGKIFHVADYKFDWTPVDGRPFDINKAAILASGGCLAVASDSLGATTPGYTQSEKEIEGRVLAIAENATGQIFFTTISSNISRMKQALNVAEKLNRKVCFIGRSIEKKAEIAKDLGYLSYPEDLVVDPRQASKYNKDRIMYVISGSYGQPGSALYRLSLGEHKFLSVEPGDVVIFSSDPAPPGSKANVDSVVDKFIEANVDVHYYDVQEDLHVSGHGSQEDIRMLFALLSPKYYIPIGGTVRHMRAYSKLAQERGAAPEDVLELTSGESVTIAGGKVVARDKIAVRDVLVDGLGVGDVGNVVLRDRHVLAREGIAIVIIQYDRSIGKLVEEPEIVSRGFVFDSAKKSLLRNASSKLVKHLSSRKKLDPKIIREETIDFLDKVFYREIGRRPMVLPVVVEV